MLDPMIATIDEKAKQVCDANAEKNIAINRDDIDNLEETIVIADENGLFKNPNCPVKISDILVNLGGATQEFDDYQNSPEKRFIQGWQKYRVAYNQLNDALNSASLGWRLSYLYGAPFIVYFVVILSGVFLAWYFFYPVILNSMVLWVASYAFLWGMVGGVLQGLWFLWQHVSDRQIRKVWIPWYVSLPLVGALLGALMYLAVIAGFMATTGNNPIQTTGNNPSQSESFIMLLCALAGFSSKWAVETLDRITNLIKIGGEPSKG
jgi:hypothetical protein